MTTYQCSGCDFTTWDSEAAFIHAITMRPHDHTVSIAPIDRRVGPRDRRLNLGKMLAGSGGRRWTDRR